jgi:hypothetical protein
VDGRNVLKVDVEQISLNDRSEPTLTDAARCPNCSDAQKADFSNISGRPRADLKRLGTLLQSQPVFQMFAATRKIGANIGLEKM